MDTFLMKRSARRYLSILKSAFYRYLRRSMREAGLNILFYHSIGGAPGDHRLGIRVPVEKFRMQMEEIKRSGYRTVTVSEIIEGGWRIQDDKIAAITFDDGYKDSATDAAMILKEYGLCATFFVTTSYISAASGKKWRDGSPRRYMDWDDVGRLAGLGFEIGSHMVHHVDLAHLGQAELEFELYESMSVIGSKIGRKVKVFSYPYGGISRQIADAARRAGYIGGCSSLKGVNKPETDIFFLKRTEIDGYDIISDFRRKLSGYY